MCSERQGGLRRAFALVSWVLLAFSSATVWAHPELLEQIARLDAEIARHPGQVEMRLQRGDLYRRDGNLAAAWQDFDAARKLDPGLVETDFYSGRLALEMGDNAAAIAQLTRYLEQRPGHAAAWSLRAEAYLAGQQPMQAAADFGEAIRTSAQPAPTLYLQQARALAEAGASRYRAALQVIDQGLQQFPRDVALLALGTDIALDLEQGELAREYMGVLPAAIRSLPQWQQRLARAESLPAREAGTEPGTRQ